jgi:uncharacterized protein DUF1800
MASYPLLAPYQPTDSDPFDRAKAAHLLNRAGFGGTPEEIDKVLKLGPSDAVDWMLDFPDTTAESQGSAGPDLSSIADLPKNFSEYRMMLQNADPADKKELQMKFQSANREAVGAIIHWWLDRMVGGPHPLQEKLTFFWHGHFTTSAKDERSATLTWNQNELLRQYAAGNFEPFLHAISHDPAMLDYLNNTQNRKEHPNENYAREVMELFTLGIGNYTEQDVKEGARAFTGWSHDGDEFIFRRGQHDYGYKTFLGRTGPWDGDDVISIILLQPACPRFVAGELFGFLAYSDFEPGLAVALGQEFYANQYAIRPVVRTILTSQAFYSPRCMGAQIKSPVQLMVGTVRLLGLPLPPDLAVISALTQMGQVPLNPPNVRGWPGGKLWINTSTLFIRYNTCVWLAGGNAPAMDRFRRNGAEGRPLTGATTMPSEFDPQAAGDADQVVDYWLSRLIQRPVDPDQRKVLISALGKDPQNTAAQRRVVQLILSTPEYQLC